MNCLLVLSLAVLGASAAPCGVITAVPQPCEAALPGNTIFAQTPFIENPTSVFPSCIPPTSVSQSCHCLKTTVRPQVRNEIISVPQIDRIVRIVPSPVVEAVTYDLGCNNKNFQVPTCAAAPVFPTCEVAPVVVEASCPKVIEAPCAKVIEAPCPKVIEAPCPKIIETPCPKIIEASCPRLFSGIIAPGCVCGANIIV